MLPVAGVGASVRVSESSSDPSAQTPVSSTGKKRLKAVISAKGENGVYVEWQGKTFFVSLVKIHPKTGKERKVATSQAELIELAAKVDAFLKKVDPTTVDAKGISSMLIRFDMKTRSDGKTSTDSRDFKGITYRSVGSKPDEAPTMLEATKYTHVRSQIDFIGENMQQILKKKPHSTIVSSSSSSTPVPQPPAEPSSWWERVKSAVSGVFSKKQP